MKKLFVIPLALVFMLTMTANITAADEIKIVINGENLAFEVAPANVNGRVLVPLRAIFEEMGAAVAWNADTQTVTATKDQTIVILTIDNRYPTINGKVVEIDQPGIIMQGRTLAPLRFVAEAFGGSVELNGASNTAIITLNIAEAPNNAVSVTAGTGKEEFKKGTVTSSGYVSEYLNLTFVLPDNYVMATEDELDDMISEITSMDQSSLESLSAEMLAASLTGDPNVIVIVEKLVLSNITEMQYLELSGTVIPDNSLNKVTEVEIAGQTYKRLKSTNEDLLIQDLYARKQDDRMILITVTYTAETTDQMKEMMSAFKPFK